MKSKNNIIKYVFFGTPQFAVIVLEELIKNGLKPAAVVTNPDRPAGRKKELKPPPVKSFLQSLQAPIPILQPESLDDNQFVEQLKQINADIFIVAAYGKILPQWLLDMPSQGVVGVHPSLLPKYRGATPMQTAILNGETKTGTTIFLLDEKMDHGPILAQAAISISSDDTYESLTNKLALLSGRLLKETLIKYTDNKIHPQPQNHRQATYTYKFHSQDAFVAWEDLFSTKEEVITLIWRKIKALNPEPGVWTLCPHLKNKRIKLLEAEIKNKKLLVTKIQIEGKKPQRAPMGLFKNCIN